MYNSINRKQLETDVLFQKKNMMVNEMYFTFNPFDI